MCKGELDSGFALVRPPGHHAHCEEDNGFCFFNNASIAANTALRSFPHIKKVAIFDWDVHCGDGTSQIHYRDPSVLYCSIHRFDKGQFYPGKVGGYERVGVAKGVGYNV